MGSEREAIGVDVRAEMVSKARGTAASLGATNLSFRLGEVEPPPVLNCSVELSLFKCVVNLSPNKPTVFQDASRMVKPGGRLAISGLVATAQLPAALQGNLAAWTGCVADAATSASQAGLLAMADFQQVHFVVQEQRLEFIPNWMPGSDVESCAAAAAVTIQAPKPGSAERCEPTCSPAEESQA